MRVGVLLDDDDATARLLAEFAAIEVSAVAVPPDHLDDAGLLAALDVLVVPADPHLLSTDRVAACDRAAVRIVPVAVDDRARRFAEAIGLVPIVDVRAAAVLHVAGIAPERTPEHRRARVIAVWGPHGAPGRTSLAIALATVLDRGGRDVCLVDADSHAPSIAQTLGISGESPGLAGACRHVARGRFDEAEFARLRAHAAAGDRGLGVLSGINRPARWPELASERVSAVLAAVREWNDHVVVDTAASLERDEALVSDLDDAPRRNAATLAALASADRIVAVTGADPVGVARFVRALPELRDIAGGTEVTVVANRVRGSVLGVDARGQIRRALERFAGVDELHTLADDPAAHDRAILTATPILRAAPRSAYLQGVRRLAAALSR